VPCELAETAECGAERAAEERNRGGARKKGQKVPFGEEVFREEDILRPPQPPYAADLPRKAAKGSGTPNSLIVT
jgi:hypothetical protein